MCGECGGQGKVAMPVSRQINVDHPANPHRSRRGNVHTVGQIDGVVIHPTIAVGDGIRAGMRIYQTLEENAHESNRLDR